LISSPEGVPLDKRISGHCSLQDDGDNWGIEDVLMLDSKGAAASGGIRGHGVCLELRVFESELSVGIGEEKLRMG